VKAVSGIAVTTIALTSVVVAAPAAYAANGTPPSTPTDLRVVQVSDTSMTLAWNASRDDGGVVNYLLYFDDNPTPILTSGLQWTQNLNRAIGMTPGSTHTFRVRAEDMSGNVSGFSTLTVSYESGDNRPPTTPQNLRVVSNTAKGMELAWDPSTDQSRITYRVVMSGYPFTTTEPRILISPNDPVAGATPGTTHTFRVIAGDKFSNISGLSNPVTATFAG
jgi:hypothetical protein